MMPKNPRIAQKGTQNNGTSPYHDKCKLPSPPPPRFYNLKNEFSVTNVSSYKVLSIFLTD